MKIAWISRKGRQRRYNSDAVALGYAGQYLIAVIVDAAERKVEGRLRFGINNKGKRLAGYWAETCMSEIRKAHQFTDDLLTAEEPLIALLSRQQKALKHDFLHDIASYGVLIIDIETGDVHWWYTGDCRVGLCDQNGVIEWLNSPHRLENTPLLGAERAGLTMTEQETAKHTLTQSLNARRFARPALVTAQLPGKAAIEGSTPEAALVLSTDGYWCEHMRHGTVMENLEDDASLLTIKHGKRSLSLQTDAPNLLVDYGKRKN